MLATVTRWSVGLTITILVGHVVARSFLNRLRRDIPTEILNPDRAGAVASWLTGVVERAFFATAVGVDLSGVGTAMMIWISVKLLTNWNRTANGKETEWIRPGAFTALLGSLVSMFFALIGGFICHGSICLP
jgi:hypothetical protein